MTTVTKVIVNDAPAQNFTCDTTYERKGKAHELVNVSTYGTEYNGKAYSVARRDNGTPDVLLVDGLPTCRILPGHQTIAANFRFTIKTVR